MAFVTPSVAGEDTEGLTTQIFIVYESHEVRLAEALKQFFEHWKVGTFYCRQKIRELAVSTPYRTILADELSAARLVILLLSRSFQWSQYCQAEAGAAATLKKHMISVIIPPSTVHDVKDISPVLESFDGVVVAPIHAHWKAGKLSDHPKPARDADEWAAHGFTNTLQAQVLYALKLELRDKEHHDAEEDRLRANVEDALRWVIEDNLLSVPPKETLSIWPSIDRKTGSLAPASIIENIKRSLTNSDIPISTLHFVGVSLKF